MAERVLPRHIFRGASGQPLLKISGGGSVSPSVMPAQAGIQPSVEVNGWN